MSDELIVKPYETRDDVVQRLSDTAAALSAERTAHAATNAVVREQAERIRELEDALQAVANDRDDRASPGLKAQVRAALCKPGRLT